MADNEMLQLILDGVNGLEQRFDGLEQRIDKLQQDVNIVKHDVDVIKQDVSDLRLTTMDMKRNVTSLGLGQVKIDLKLTSLTDELGEISDVIIANYKRLEVTNDMVLKHEHRFEGTTDVLSAV